MAVDRNVVRGMASLQRGKTGGYGAVDRMGNRQSGSVVRIDGVATVVTNLNFAVADMVGRSKEALAAAALMVEGRSLELTPVDTGNLRGSAYTQTRNTPVGPVAEIGYTASYAVNVHETDRAYRQGQWKFLQTAMADKQGDVLALLAAAARIDAANRAVTKSARAKGKLPK